MTEFPSAIGDLRAAFLVLAPRSAHLTESDLAMLRRRVCAAVDEMKSAGVLPERVVVAVKGLATDAGIRWTSDDVVEKLVSSCVDEYYAQPD